MDGLEAVMEKEWTPTNKCKECSLSFQEKSDLKMYILDLHPRQYICKLCADIFETSVVLELHLNIHNTEKDYKYELCDEAFHMKRR